MLFWGGVFCVDICNFSGVGVCFLCSICIVWFSCIGGGVGWGIYFIIVMLIRVVSSRLVKVSIVI